MSAHAPGPWTYEVHQLSGGYSGIVYDANGYRVGTDHLSEADAALISAAHELADLARNVAGFDDHFLTTPDLNLLRATLREFRDQARAAIAKAEGPA